jgi:hypothetical protein
MYSHRQGFHTLLITVRDSIRNKDFKSSEANLQASLSMRPQKLNDDLLEIGVGYTLTDCLILRAHYSYKKIYLFDVQALLNIRLYCWLTLLNPLNYTNRYFKKNLKIIFSGALGGESALMHHKIKYVVNRELQIPANCDIFSNAVLEHLSIVEINNLLSNVASGVSPISFFGIVDTNDHKNRTQPQGEQFKNYSGTEDEVQERGNKIFLDEWRCIMQNFFSDVKIEEHLMLGSIGKGVGVFSAR